MDKNGKGLKIIGAGFGRTGTSSLKRALEMLGYNPTYHMEDVVEKPFTSVPLWAKVSNLPFRKELDDFIDEYSHKINEVGKDTEESKQARHRIFKTIFEGYEAAVDHPASIYFQDLMEIYPDAKVILSTREFESWYRSASKTIFKFIPNNYDVPYGIALFKLLFPAGRAFGSISNFYSVFPINDGKDKIKIAYDAWVDYVKQTVPKERLLVVQVGKEGWKPFCSFLEIKDCPTVPFPHVNDEAEMIAKMQYSSIAGYISLLILVFGLAYCTRRITKLLFPSKSKTN